MPQYHCRLPLTHPAYDRCRSAHELAETQGELGYTDPISGLFVMTATYLRERGYCCDGGCRHCPWPQTRPSGQQPAGDPDP